MRVETVSLKGSGALNEDALLIKKNLFAVFDGATSLTGYKNKQGKTGGWLASHIAKQAFAKNNQPLIGLFEKANQALASALRRARINVKHKEEFWITAVAALCLSKNNFEYASIGDALILIITKSGRVRLVNKYINHDAASLRAWHKLRQLPYKVRWQRLQQQFLKVRRTANKKGGRYGMLNGEPAALNFVQHGIYPLKNIKQILLFTDGFFFPTKNVNHAPAWQQYYKLLKNGGLKNAARRLRALEKTDPECRRYPRFKPHDDLTAIRLIL